MNNIINMKKGLGIFLGLQFFFTFLSFSCKKKQVAPQPQPQFTVSSAQVVFESEGSSSNVSITSNGNWTATANSSTIWFTISKSSGGPGNVTLKLIADANNTGAGRKAMVTINTSNGDVKQIEVSQPDNQNLLSKFAIVSPKLLTNSGNPLLDFMFTADPTAIAYNGRVYVYATNDNQQYLKVGPGGTNSAESIRSLVMMSSDDMVNWTYHGLINTAKLAPWTASSWAPSIESRMEADGKTHFYMYYSNNAFGSAVLTSTSPVGPWKDPLGKAIVDHSVPGVDVDVPFDPGVVIDKQGTGWLVFGGGAKKTPYMPGNARIVKLGADMISLASSISQIPAPYFNEASDLNFINGTWVYTYCTNWDKRDVWPYSNILAPTACNISYMTSKTPLDSGSWKYGDNYFKNPGEHPVGDNVGPYTNNHSHLFTFQGKWYFAYHAMYLQDYFNTKGGFRNVGIEVAPMDTTNGVKIPMINATFKGPSQTKLLNPFVLQQAETTAGTSGHVTFDTAGIVGNMVAIAQIDKQVLMVRGADFSKQIPAKFEARVKGTGQIDVYVNNLKGPALVSLKCDAKDWTTLSAQIQQNIPKGVGNIYFVFYGEGFLFDEWKFD
ncbi:family 43 glycosylhydrolase [Mucilaginibacter sp. BJC16-A38]|uniref:family 43 glycosylhydrolase n=1 Tax=Mucilaginibacter phenanthrenivorans TaxID=1234842 RepID=UPI0021576CC3|nr:family 43 glycosylhydrolase [Mucilaginibacter phenanthrenivorans]MCR8558835.1 family 43 glycosylhydrolase [Mucilaginibacter phenanthrenivorans]